jgi:hypothetical protein
VWEWNGTIWTRTIDTTSIQFRRHAALAYHPGLLQTVLYGGATEGGTFYGDTWLLSGSAWATVPTHRIPTGREGHALACDERRGRAVLFGGVGEADTWEHDGVNWIRLALAASPAIRQLHGLAFDAERGRVVLFGGFDALGGLLADTWTFDGAQWVEVGPATSPSGRSSFGMTYDAANERVVLFGGYGALMSARDDTWAFDGVAWTQVPAVTAPPARADLALAYDRHRERVVLFGGSVDHARVDDTWELDGATWTLVPTLHAPPARDRHTLSYDLARRRVVLFGGRDDAGAPLDDTWEYDGSDWLAIPTVDVPAARWYAAQCYDPERGATVLFGGHPTNQETWEYRWDSSAPDEHCTNGVDDDGDGLADCADPDCEHRIACRGAGGVEVCDNGVDDDGDGLVDCADAACDGRGCGADAFCVEQTCRPCFGGDAGYLGCEGGGAFEDIAATGSHAGGSDEGRWAVPIGFTFTFYGQDHTTVYAQANGGLTFTDEALPYANACLPAATAPFPLIAPLWDDLDSGTSPAHGVYHQTVGVAGSRRLIVQWITPVWQGTDPATFQAVLHEATGHIELRYLDVGLGNAASDAGASATVGVQAGDGVRAVPFSCDEAVLLDGAALTFRPR